MDLFGRCVQAYRDLSAREDKDTVQIQTLLVALHTAANGGLGIKEVRDTLEPFLDAFEARGIDESLELEFIWAVAIAFPRCQ